MNNIASEDEIAAAMAYENLHVPALFQQWAPRMVAAADIKPGQQVLDVACGTGVLAREVASAMQGKGAVVGLDPSPGMLAVASKLLPSVDWQAGFAEQLPFEENSFDAVVSQFGMMFFRDRHSAIREMLRVLKPGGKLVIAVWDSLDNAEAYPIEVNLLEKLAGKTAADALRAPFVLGDRNTLTMTFETAGATILEITTQSGTARFPSIRTMVEADLRGWLPVMGVMLEEDKIQGILQAAEQALAQYVTASGSVVFDAPAHIVVARKPQ